MRKAQLTLQNKILNVFSLVQGYLFIFEQQTNTSVIATNYLKQSTVLCDSVQIAFILNDVDTTISTGLTPFPYHPSKCLTFLLTKQMQSNKD